VSCTAGVVAQGGLIEPTDDCDNHIAAAIDSSP
jgi:hypothetical protein